MENGGTPRRRHNGQLIIIPGKKLAAITSSIGMEKPEKSMGLHPPNKIITSININAAKLWEMQKIIKLVHRIMFLSE